MSDAFFSNSRFCIIAPNQGWRVRVVPAMVDFSALKAACGIVISSAEEA